MDSRYTAPRRHIERLNGPTDSDVGRHPANHRSETSRAGMAPGNAGVGVAPLPGVMRIPAAGDWKIGYVPEANVPLVKVQVEYERGIFTDWLPVEMAQQLVNALEAVIAQATTGLVITDRMPGH